MSRYDVLLTGAETHQGIVVMRSLHQRGVRTLVTSDNPRSIGFYSKLKSGRALLPSAVSQKEAFVDELLALVEQYDIPHIYPVTETSLITLDEQRERVDNVAKLLAPSSETIRCGVDKKLTMEIARQEGVPIPSTLYPGSTGEAKAFAEEHGYPVIFKPRGRSSDARIEGTFNFKVQYCHNRQELERFLSQFADGVYPMMQDYAYGPHTQFMCFVENGREVHSCFQDQMVRMLPMTGGVGARRLSCEIVPKVHDWSTRMFFAMNWEGCAQTQWKGPDENGRYTFLEVSVRIIASIGSVVCSGIDHPWMHYQYFTGQQVDRADTFQVGKHSRWFRGDTITVTRHLIGDMPKAADPLPPRYRVFLSWLYDFVRPGLNNDVERFSDPIPGLIEVSSLVIDLMRIVRRRVTDKLPVLRSIKHRIVGDSG